MLYAPLTATQDNEDTPLFGRGMNLGNVPPRELQDSRFTPDMSGAVLRTDVTPQSDFKPKLRKRLQSEPEGAATSIKLRRCSCCRIREKSFATAKSSPCFADRRARRANHRMPHLAEHVYPFQKKYSVLQNYKSALYPFPSCPTERGARDRHDAGQDAMDAEGAEDVRHRMRTAKSYGPDASTVGVKLVEQFASDGVNKARSPGRVRSNRKTSRAERRVFWCICGDCCGVAFFSAPPAAGASSARRSHALTLKGRTKIIPRAKKIHAARSRTRIWPSLRGAKATKQSTLALPRDGLLR